MDITGNLLMQIGLVIRSTTNSALSEEYTLVYKIRVKVKDEPISFNDLSDHVNGFLLNKLIDQF